MFSEKRNHLRRPAFSQALRLAKLACGSGVFILLGMISCETHKDPFSASNTAPGITTFEFDPDLSLPDPNLRADSDSLKFVAGKAYPITLVYRDTESQRKDRKLFAEFKFLTTVKGRISSNRFVNPTGDGLNFEVPPDFDDEVLMIPEKSGIVDLQLIITDGVKDSQVRTASTVLFENLKPVVRFSAQLTNQEPPYGVDFDASAADDRDGEIATYTWMFGDGTSSGPSNSSNAHHDYQSSGAFTVRLKITDDEGAVDSLDQVITTTNLAPTAALSVDPNAGKAPLVISYDARNSRDRDGSIVSYDIAFGDGQSSSSPFGTHRFTTDAVFPVRLTVRDNLGSLNTITVPVTVSTPPIAVLSVVPDSAAFPVNVMLDGTGSYDPLGSPLRDPEILINNQPTYSQLKVTHPFRSPGDFRITLQVRHNRNPSLIGSDEKVVRIINLRPVADFTWERDLGNVTFTSTSYDPNAPDDQITNYRWNFGDGSQEQSGATFSTIQHTYTRSGVYNVNLTVTDNFGGMTTITKAVEVR